MLRAFEKNSPLSTTRAHSIVGSRNKKVTRGHSARTRTKQKRAQRMPSGTETRAKQCERVPRDAATPRGATKLEMKRLSTSGAALRARAHRAHHEAQHESQPTQLTPQAIASIVNLPPGDVLATKLHPRKNTQREINRVHRVTVEPGICRFHQD